MHSRGCVAGNAVILLVMGIENRYDLIGSKPFFHRLSSHSENDPLEKLPSVANSIY